MERLFTVELGELKHRLLFMGGLAEHSLQQSICALSQHNRQAIQRVLDEEMTINQLQIEMDARVMQLIARYQLVATDLRFVLAVERINSELERVADQAVNIAQTTQRMLQRSPGAVSTDLFWMSDVAGTMLHDSLDAFARGDLEIAYSVLKRDDQVDELRDRLLHELLTQMVDNPGDIVPAFDRILVAKSLERIGDHATNIAEDVIYVVAGDDVRHHSGDQQRTRKAGKAEPPPS